MIKQIQKHCKNIVNDPNTSKWALWSLLLLLIFIIALILTPHPTTQSAFRIVGEKVWDDIRSDYDFTVTDVVATDERRKQAEDFLLPVYDYDSRLQNNLEERLTEIFNDWRQIMRDRRLQQAMNSRITFIGPLERDALQTQVPIDNSVETLENDYKLFLTSSGLKVSLEIFQLLREMEFKFRIELPFHTVLSHICSYAIVSNRNMMRDIADSGLIRRDMYTQEERVIHNLDTVISLDVAYREIDDSVTRLLPDNQLLQDITAEITRSL
ncbi:hypothetical protein K8T06_14490, partial [bacterium]|nr:hypothetical protein [bacterium]